ncbi:hypothetical protein, partial [Algibacillus agarilyticus]|uniref:hypothetical protein n=1 Tax=Algibacillus agarilyticus TaxID=2234133 RepID=UPI001E4B37F6
IVLFLLFILGCSNSEVKKIYGTCMSMEKPLKADELYNTFNNGELLESNENGNEIHFFSPHPDYNLIYSSFIVAEVDRKGMVLHLKCSEEQYAF